MNRIFLFFILIAAFSFGARISYGWDLPLNVEVYELSFNHDTSSTSSDGITVRSNGGALIQAPEFSGGGTTNNKFAYLKTTSNPTVKARFYTTESGITSLTIFVLPNGGDPTWYLSSEDVSFSSATSDLATYTSTGVSFPSMGTYYTDWGWRVFKINGVQQTPTISIDGTYFDYYVVHQTPVAPMQEPWVGVLEKSCTWANGETTVSGIASEIADNLYSSGFNYEHIGGRRQYGSASEFYLSYFLSDYGTGAYANCLDMAKAVVCFSNAVGCSLLVRTYGRFDGTGNPLDHPVNCIDPIGNISGPTNSPIGDYVNIIQNDCRSADDGFLYHAYAYNSDAGTVWDATLKYDTGSDPDHVGGSNPGCGDITYPTPNWTLPTNISESSYKTNLLDPYPSWFQNQPGSQNVTFYIAP